MTQGVHHVGLTVSEPDISAAFFIQLLGWKEVRRNDDYPAVFVSDEVIMLSLWAAKEQPVYPFNRRSRIGLHHLALQVVSEAILHEIHQRVINSGAIIEFSPEPLRQGPAMHMMCYEPGGIRVEFIWPGIPL